MIALLDGPPINLIISALLRRSRLIKIKCNNITIIRASFKWARAWRTLKTCDGGTNGVRRMTAKAFNTRQPWPFPTVTVCIPIRDHSNRSCWRFFGSLGIPSCSPSLNRDTYPAFSAAAMDMWGSSKSWRGEWPWGGAGGAVNRSVVADTPATWIREEREKTLLVVCNKLGTCTQVLRYNSTTSSGE